MKGINVYAPLLGLLMVMVVVGLSLHFNSLEKQYVSTFQTKLSSVRSFLTADILLWDALTGGESYTFQYIAQRVSRPPPDLVASLSNKDLNDLLPEDPLEIYAITFGRETTGVVKRVEAEIYNTDRTLKAMGDYLVVETEYNGFVLFSLESGRMIRVSLPKRFHSLIPLRVRELSEKLRLLSSLSPEVNAYQGLFYDGGLKFIHGSTVDFPVCNVANLESMAWNGLEELLREVENCLRSYLAGTDVNLIGCEADRVKVLPDSSTGTSAIFTGLLLKSARCTFTFRVGTSGLGKLNITVRLPVPVENSFPDTPTGPFQLRFQGGCLVKR